MERSTAAYRSMYLHALVLGFVLMGFEMLGSRYLNPYFGGGIGTWASLISTVLAALMVGYLAGGHLVDRHPSARVCGVLVLASGVYLLVVPRVADGVIELTMRRCGDGAAGVLAAAMLLFFVPSALLGTFSPFGVRLLLTSPERGGRVAGWVYGVSTIGNILGTLVTAFVLIPSIGVRAITQIFGLVVLASGAVLVLGGRAARR